MRTYENSALRRIDKKAARNLFNTGQEVIACPCKADPCNSYWSMAFILKKPLTDDFDIASNSTTYYNCNHETGYYLSYYAPQN